jgi:NHL repeat-containing protein
LRVDPQDNIWTMDIGANQVVKFDTNGAVQLVLGRKPETIGVRPAAPRGGAGTEAAPAAAVPAVPGGAAPAAGRGARGGGGAAGAAGAAAPAEAAPQAAAAARGAAGGRGAGAGTAGSAFSRPTDVAWDRAGNIFIADGIGTNNRIAKFDKDGKFLKSWGQTGTENGLFNRVRSIALDAQGNVYVADEGNKRIQVFDGEGNFKSQITGIGSPQAICITRGATQYIYSAHSGDPDGMVDAAIYKVTLDGKVVGKFGSAGKLVKQFGLVNSIDCRNENELLVGEMTNWRVQKLTLRPSR